MNNKKHNSVTTNRKNRRFHEMIAEDARKVATEWRELGIEDALTMLAMTREAIRNGEPLPEPAEQAREQLRAYMHPNDIEIAWPEMLDRIGFQLQL